MKVKSVQEASTNKLLKKDNVCGTGVGEKWVGGKPTGEQAVLVFVQKKYTKVGMFRKYSADEIIPEKIDGVPTDVIEVGRIVKQSGLKTKVRPIEPGYSCGHGDITAGTIGGFFFDADGTPVILSNNHVVANENAAKIGDIVYQPGPTDSRKRHPIGRLKKFVRIKKNGNIHDSGIVEIDPTLIAGNMIKPYYPVINNSIKGFGNATINMQVQKCGRTTGYTTGRVIGLNGTFSIEYDFGVAKFEKCIVMSAMSKGGDSGSVVTDMNMNAVGLLFAGSPKVTLANPMSFVQQHYGLRIWDAPPTEEIKIGGDKWQKFTTDGTITQRSGVVTIKENANQHCFLEHSLTGNTKMVACTVNTGNDKGATWGPGLVLQFPTGMLKVNLRHNGEFGGYFNDRYFLNVGKVKPNTEYRLRIRRHNSAWVGEVQDNGKWYTAVAIPQSVFRVNPIAVRIGKTGLLGSTRDHGPSNSQQAGPEGTCKITDFVIR